MVQKLLNSKVCEKPLEYLYFIFFKMVKKSYKVGDRVIGKTHKYRNLRGVVRAINVGPLGKLTRVQLDNGGENDVTSCAINVIESISPENETTGQMNGFSNHSVNNSQSIHDSSESSLDTDDSSVVSFYNTAQNCPNFLYF
jgi:hypothetical protein